jgi:hypothetical protein
LYSVSETGPFFSLPEDFETRDGWRRVQGSGTVSIETRRKIAGQGSLVVAAASPADFLIERQMSETLDIKRYALAVLLYSGYNPIRPLSGDRAIMIPRILIRAGADRDEGILRIGKINFGLPVRLPEARGAADSPGWVSDAFVAVVPPGRYSLDLQLGSPGGQTTLYDGLRFFLLEIPATP